MAAFAQPLPGDQLLWLDGKHYAGDSSIYDNNDVILGFAHVDIIDGNGKARLTMKLVKGISEKRKDGCFEIEKGKSIKPISCNW